MVVKGADIQEAFPDFSPTTSVLALLLSALERRPGKVLQIEAWSGKSATSSDTLQLSKSVAAELRSRGVTVGDFVVMTCEKSVLAFSLLLGAIFTGATVVVITPQTADQIHLLTGDHPLKVVFCEASVLDSVKQSLSKKPSQPLLVATTDPEDCVAKTLTTSHKVFQLFNVTDVTKHIPVIYFTSGSTGEPKGVLIPDLALQRLGYSYEDESIESYLLSSPFSWISSPISMVSSILKGYTLILNNSREPRIGMQLIHKYKVNGWLIPAQNLKYFTEEPSLPDMDFSSLVFIIIGADVLMRRCAKRFVNKVLKGQLGVQNIYGMTETGLLTTWRHSDLLDLTKANSAGYLAPGVQAKITEGGREVVPGSVGEVWVKSLSLMAGYWNRQQLNQQIFDKDGFFQTGDAGYFDSDGYLYVIGRISSLVSIGGKQISLAHIEDVLKSHPDVLEGVVVAKPHPEDAYHLTAFVVKKPTSDISAEDVVTFVEEEVEDEKKLKGGVCFVDSIPKTPNNKIVRRHFDQTI